MKKLEELQKKLGVLDQGDIEKLRTIKGSLSSFIEQKNIDEKGLRSLENMVLELENLKQSYTWRLIRILKQGHMLD